MSAAAKTLTYAYSSIIMYIMRLVMKKAAIYEARNSLTGYIHAAEQGTDVELTRHGKPAAVLVGYDRYTELTSTERTFAGALTAFLTAWPADILEHELEADLEGTRKELSDPFADIREKDPGRRYPW